MKSFYSTEPIIASSHAISAPSSPSAPPNAPADPVMTELSRARVAVYEGPAAAPRVVDVEPSTVPEYIEALAATVHRLAAEQGGAIPYSVIREISENLIHAAFAEPVVSIMDGGATIRFSDCGPGIDDKTRAVLPGYTTANASMKRYIRGVGSGLPLVKDFLAYSGGALIIEDNLGRGAVVTVSARQAAHTTGALGRSADDFTARLESDSFEQNALPVDAGGSNTGAPAAPPLTTRQKQVLALVMESGTAGPSLVSRELNVGVSTAYRDLASLEELGLIESDGGRRTLTDRGLSYLNALMSGV